MISAAVPSGTAAEFLVLANESIPGNPDFSFILGLCLLLQKP
jgi:hypothetical protein